MWNSWKEFKKKGRKKSMKSVFENVGFVMIFKQRCFSIKEVIIYEKVGFINRISHLFIK